MTQKALFLEMVVLHNGLWNLDSAQETLTTVCGCGVRLDSRLILCLERLASMLMPAVMPTVVQYTRHAKASLLAYTRPSS